MDRFEEKRDVNIKEIASATGDNDVNFVTNQNDYDHVNAGGFNKFMSKFKKVSDVVNKGSILAKGASDAYEASKNPQKTEEPQAVVQDINIPEQPKSKMPLIIGGAVVGVIILGIIIYKITKK